MPVQKFLSLNTVRRGLVFAAGVSLSISFSSSASANNSLEENWLEFQRDPVQFMDKAPVKRDANGQVVSTSIFSSEDIASQEFISKKESFRLSKTGSDLVTPMCNKKGVCLPDVIEGRAAAKESVLDFLDMYEFSKKDLKPISSLEEMEAKKLMSAKLDETPWSDNYWPISQGILGNRYASSVFTADRGHNWKSYYDFIKSPGNTFKEIYATGDADKIADLSPSEKYDLLIGDLTGPDQMYEAGYLTPQMWLEGEEYWKSSGKVEPWMGICHGWAAAAFMMERPRQTVTVTGADEKTQLKFYPSDLKGLASHLWAKASVPTNFIGGRCNDKKPKKDEETGRNISEKCFDTNPANWHLAVVNQLGLAKRSLIIDATYDYEVWNQPVYSYKYRYFNPQTGKSVKTLAEATVAVADFTKDKFKKFRSKKAAFVVGIEMDISYAVETKPTHRETDDTDYDMLQSATYMYDLELNSKNQVLGGEWYSNKHPDFLWLPVLVGRAESYGDSMIGGEVWDASQPLPQFWRDLAIATATRYNQPLAGIVESLFSASQMATKK